jgi:hypothetical protein
MSHAVISSCNDRNLRHLALVGFNFVLEVCACVRARSRSRLHVRASGVAAPAGLCACALACSVGRGYT